MKLNIFRINSKPKKLQVKMIQILKVLKRAVRHGKL